MFNHLKPAHGACVKKAKQFMLVKSNSVPLKLEELQHFASFPNIVCTFPLKTFLQFKLSKCLILKLRSRVKSISTATEINRAMEVPVLHQIMFPLQHRRDIS